MKPEFIKAVRELGQLLHEKSQKLPGGKLRDYGYGQIDLRKKRIAQARESVRASAFDLAGLYRHDSKNREPIIQILEIVKGDFDEKLADMLDLADDILAPQARSLNLSIPQNLPSEIRAHVAADLREMEKAYNAGCFRAATILLGRVLEACLHRKYFDATGMDILEKNPGIGLGKLIAKLAEKNVEFDPGLTQQIHLINQVRIHSVHVKKSGFYPSGQQTYAMILYTIDVIEKMF